MKTSPGRSTRPGVPVANMLISEAAITHCLNSVAQSHRITSAASVGAERSPPEEKPRWWMDVNMIHTMISALKRVRPGRRIETHTLTHTHRSGCLGWERSSDHQPESRLLTCVRFPRSHQALRSSVALQTMMRLSSNVHSALRRPSARTPGLTGGNGGITVSDEMCAIVFAGIWDVCGV